MKHPMIVIDGRHEHKNNSDGNPVHHTTAGITKFYRMFHESDNKVIDGHGRPNMNFHKITESKYYSFLEFINEEGEGTSGTSGTVSVDASPAPIANTTKNFVNPQNKKLMPSILRRPKAKIIGQDETDTSDTPSAVVKPKLPTAPKPSSDNKPALPSIKQTPPKLGANPPKIKTAQKYS